MRMRLCPDCDTGIAYGRATVCASCKRNRHRAAARKWYAANRERDNARRSAASRALTTAQRAQRRLAEKAARIYPHDPVARRALREAWRPA